MEEARSLVQMVAKGIQSQLEFKISDIATKALQVVIGEDISMKLEFVAKRGNSEVNIYFEKNGELVDPMEASGRGLVDIGAFALRISVWKISKPKSSPVFIFDEPFRNLSKNYHDAMYAFIQTISKKLGIQIIMITHEDDFIKNADRVFDVELIDGVSQIHTEV